MGPGSTHWDDIINLGHNQYRPGRVPFIRTYITYMWVIMFYLTPIPGNRFYYSSGNICKGKGPNMWAVRNSPGSCLTLFSTVCVWRFYPLFGHGRTIAKAALYSPDVCKTSASGFRISISAKCSSGSFSFSALRVHKHDFTGGSFTLPNINHMQHTGRNSLGYL